MNMRLAQLRAGAITLARRARANWKTSATGTLAFIGGVSGAMASDAHFRKWGWAFSLVSLAIGQVCGRDGDKSDQDVGLRPDRRDC